MLRSGISSYAWHPMAFRYHRSVRSTISVDDLGLSYRPRRRPESCAAIGAVIFLGILAGVLACVL